MSSLARHTKPSTSWRALFSERSILSRARSARRLRRAKPLYRIERSEVSPSKRSTATSVAIAQQSSRLVALSDERRRTGKRKREMFRRVRRAGYYCTFCGHKMAEEQKTVEHLIPLSQGGSNHRANLSRSCGDCNSSRGSKTHVLPKYHTTTGELMAPHEIKRIMAAAESVRKFKPSPSVRVPPRSGELPLTPGATP